jgi:hypothetical protein
MLKDKVYVNNPHSLWEQKENMQQEIPVISRQLCRVSRNICSRCDTCTEAEGQHFETLLSTVVGHTIGGKQAAYNQLLLLCYAGSLP